MARPQVVSKYYSGQGICMMGERDPATGRPMGMLPIGNVPELTLSISTTSEDHRESWSGNRGIDDTTETEINVSASITFESFDAKNLALGLRASATDVEAGTAATFDTPLYEDKWMPLPHLSVSNVSISTGDEGTDYEVDEEGAMIKLIEGGALIDGDEVEVTYDHGAIINVQALVENAPERYFIFNGLNTKDGKPTRLEIFRLQTQPFSDLGVINDGIAQFSLESNALADSFRTGSGESKFFQQLLSA